LIFNNIKESTQKEQILTLQTELILLSYILEPQMLMNGNGFVSQFIETFWTFN